MKVIPDGEEAVVQRVFDSPEAVCLESQGYKHSAVPILCAALLTDTLPLCIENVPDVEDIRVLVRLINLLGGCVVHEGSTITVYSANLCESSVPRELGTMVHGTIYLWPVLLALTGRVDAPIPGGCALGGDAYPNGGRPVENVLQLLRLFGADVEIFGARVRASLTKRWGAERRAIDLLQWSHSRRRMNGPEVTSSSKIALLLASAFPGQTTIGPIPRRESVQDLLEFICACVRPCTQSGATVVVGKGELGRRNSWLVASDPTEVMTFVAIAAQVGTRMIEFRNVSAEMAGTRMKSEVERLVRMGIEVGQVDSSLFVQLGAVRRGTRVVTSTDGLNTDSQPFFAALFASGKSPGKIADTIWRNRYGYVDSMRQFGLKVQRTPLGIEVFPGKVTGVLQPLSGSDTRQSALLCCLAAAVPGGVRTTIEGVRSHIERGYSDFPTKLRAFGVSLDWK